MTMNFLPGLLPPPLKIVLGVIGIALALDAGLAIAEFILIRTAVAPAFATRLAIEIIVGAACLFLAFRRDRRGGNDS